jgi:exopolysaccharide production protein ExoQ
MLNPDRLVIFGALLTAAMWVAVAVQKHGGLKTHGRRLLIGALLWVAGLETAITQVLTPRQRVDDPSAVSAPAAAAVSHDMALTCLTLAIIGTVFGLASRGRGFRAQSSLLVLAGVWALALGPLLASQLGTAPEWRKGLVYLPLLASAIYLNADGDMPWLVTQLRRLTRVYTYGTLVAFLLANSWATYPPPPDSPARAWFGIQQVAGLTPHPNSLGPVAALALTLELASVYRAKHWRWHVVVALVVVMLAQSRSGLTMTTVAVALLHTPSSGRTRIGRLISPVLYPVLIVGTAVTLGLRGDLPTTGTQAGILLNGLLDGRTSVWRYAWAEFQRNHLFGYGPGLFSPAYRSLLPEQLQFAGQAHNQVLQTMGEAGLVGLTGLALYLASLLLCAIRSNNSLAGLPLALFASLIVRMTAEAPLRNYNVDISLFMHLVVIVVLVYAGVSQSDGHAAKDRMGERSLALAA